MAQEFLRTTIEVETSPQIITQDHWLEIAEEKRVKRLPNGTEKKVSAYARIIGQVDPLIYHWGYFFGGRDWARIATMPTIELQEVPSRNPFSSRTRMVPVNCDTTLFRQMREFARKQATYTYTLQDHTIYAKGGKGPTIPGQKTGIYLQWTQNKDYPEENHWEGTLLELYGGGPTPEWIPTGIPIRPEVTAKEVESRWLLGPTNHNLMKTSPDILLHKLEQLISHEPEVARERLRYYWECKGGLYIPQLSNPFFGISEQQYKVLEGLSMQL